MMIAGFDRMRIIAGVVLALVVGSTGLARAQTAEPRRKMMAYHPDQPVPAGYHVEHRTRYGLLISGAVLFGVTYVPTAAAAYFDSRDGTPLYVVPILGPLFAIPRKTQYSCEGDQGGDQGICADFTPLIAAFLVADAVVQATGAIIAWRGFLGRDVLIRDESVSAAFVPGPVGGTGYGGWLTGRF